MGAPEAPVVVEAHTLERGPDGTLTASDDVLIQLPDGRWTSDRAVLSPDGSLRMEGVEGAVGGHAFQAGTLARGANGTLAGTDLVWAPCACNDGDPPLVLLEAARGELDEDALQLEHVRARVGGVPTVALPRLRTSLDPDRWRLLLPEVGVTERGANLLVGARGAAFGQDTHVRAGWRGGTGPMTKLSLATDAGQAHLVAAWDVARAEPRGALQARAAMAQRSRAALEIDVATDADVARDLGGDVETRLLPWRESRVLLEGGPLRLDGRIGDDGSRATLGRARLRKHARIEREGRSVDAAVWVDGRLDARDTAELDPRGRPRTGEVSPEARTGATLETDAALGPTQASARAFVASDLGDVDDPDAVASASWTIRAWRTSNGGLLRLEPGLEVTAVSVNGPARLLAGPRVAASWSNGRSRVSADGTVAVESQAPTLTTAGRLRAEHGTVKVVATHDPVGTQTSVEFGGERARVHAGYVHARRADAPTDDALLAFASGSLPWLRASGDAVSLAEAGASLTHARWLTNVWVGVSADGTPALRGVRGAAGYDDGCVAVVLRGGYARLDDGPALVDATLSLTLRPPSSTP